MFNTHHIQSTDEKTAVLAGLKQRQKCIDPKYFYDTKGSELFEHITQQQEYYPTRTERAILSQNASSISLHCGQNSVVIEPGSGSSEKIRLLLNAIKPKAYVPIDIATQFLQRSAGKLKEEFPWLNIHAVSADFAQLKEVPDTLPRGRRVIFYPGSTLGNMTPDQALLFLAQLRQWIVSGEHKQGGVLIGVDLHKSTEVLNAAYNDKQGVTAAFNLNVLNNINSLMDADFDIANFAHKAFYNEQHQRIEMHLISQLDHTVTVADTAIRFAKGESIHTENSYKYTVERFKSLAERVNFNLKASWLDADQLFSVHYLEIDR